MMPILFLIGKCAHHAALRGPEKFDQFAYRFAIRHLFQGLYQSILKQYVRRAENDLEGAIHFTDGIIVETAVFLTDLVNTGNPHLVADARHDHIWRHVFADP